MKNRWIRKNDHVVVIAGNDKGKAGQVVARQKDKILVEGINIRKKHTKRTQENQSAQIIEREMPIHISNVSMCDADGKKIRLSTKVSKKGGRDLVYQKDGKEVVLRTLKKIGNRKSITSL